MCAFSNPKYITDLGLAEREEKEAVRIINKEILDKSVLEAVHRSEVPEVADDIYFIDVLVRSRKTRKNSLWN